MRLKPKNVARYVSLWIAFLLSFALALWSLNLVVFHGWAAYVPPYETAFHLRWAKLWAAVGLAALALAVFSGRKIWLGGPTGKSSGA
jgi:hypothetical protein